MKIRTILLIVTLSMTMSELFSQVNYIVDERDGQKYDTVSIGDLIWFKENLKYKTETSYCWDRKDEHKHCTDVNFYTNKQLHSLCPAGWRFATKSDWESTFEFIKKDNKIKEYQLEYRPVTLYPDTPIIVEDTTNTLNIFSKNNRLDLKEFGWVEGKRLRKMEITTYWINNEDRDDDKYHLHIGETGYFIHSHDHNVIAKPRKQRRFAMRCVTDK